MHHWTTILHILSKITKLSHIQTQKGKIEQ